MRASFIATLIVVATAFAPTLCASLDSSLPARDSAPNVRAVSIRDGAETSDPPLEPYDPSTFAPQDPSTP